MKTGMVIAMVSKIAGIVPIGAVRLFQENDRTHEELMKRRSGKGFQSALQTALRKEALPGERLDEGYRIHPLNAVR